jgi:hypothetical protein
MFACVVSFHLPGRNERDGRSPPSGAGHDSDADACRATGARPQETRGYFRLRLRYRACGVAGIFGQDVDIGKGISDLLVTYLVKDGSYSVIERKALDKILAEQNFSNSDRANPTKSGSCWVWMQPSWAVLRNSAMKPRIRTSAAQAEAGRAWALEDLAQKVKSRRGFNCASRRR